MARLPRLYAPITVAGVRGGTPLSLDAAVDVLWALDREYAKIERQYFNAVDRFESVRTRAAKDRWRRKLDEFRGPFKRIEDGRTRLENMIDEYTSAVAREEERKEKKRKGEARAEEWQFGLSYTAARRGGHDVDLNVNIRRVDGKPITAAQAREALRVRIETGAFPDAYEVAEILYRSPGSHSPRGRTFRDGGHDAESLDESFAAIIESTRLADWRMGGIEE